MSKRNYISYHLWVFATLLLILVLSSCSVKKYIPDDELLYNSGTVEVIDTVTENDNDNLKSELQSVLFPDANMKTWIGYPKLYFYYKAQREHPGIINKFLNKQIGEDRKSVV